jgi:hypothetical protein
MGTPKKLNLHRQNYNSRVKRSGFASTNIITKTVLGSSGSSPSPVFDECRILMPHKKQGAA